MLYRYRLLFAVAFGFMLLAIAYMYDIHPRLAHIANLKQTENDLNETLVTTKRSPYTAQAKKAIKVESEKNILNDLSELIEYIRISGLITQSIELPSHKSNKPYKQAYIRLMLKGDYQQLTAFINKLEQQQGSYAVQDFSYKWTENNGLQMTVDVLSFDRTDNKRLVYDDKTTLIPSNPFCLTNSASKWANDNNLNEALLAPIEQIKMVGYLQLGKHRQALVLLPNAVMRTVEIGFLLGSEKGEVIAINKEQIIVKLPDERQVLLALAAR